MTGIHQFIAGYSRGDAISNEARVLREMFRSWGHPSELYCETRRILPELRRDARDIAEAAGSIRPEDVALLHLSIGSPVNDAFAALDCRKVLYYHNITPPDFFRGLQDEIVRNLETGRRQMKELAGKAGRNIAVSAFNAAELEANGYEDVRVIPLMLDRSQWVGPADRRIIQQYRDGMINILFVGRCAPNKRIEDLLFTLYYMQKYVNADTRLIHVGSHAGLERYYALLRTKARELGLANIVFTGSIPQEELRAWYKVADVFLCMSEHEGFCIPLIEAMGQEVPVLAFDAGAVADTLDGSGILFREKRYDQVAEMIGRLHCDAAFHEAVVRQQCRRLEKHLLRDIEQEWRDVFEAEEP